MGRSRVKRGKAKAESAPVPQRAVPSTSNATVSPPIPDITGLDMAFGKIDHMPRYDTIPDEFKRSGGYCAAFVSKWFFGGLKEDDLARLKPRAGVDKRKALAAIGAILRSFEPKHEHKEAGCAFLLNAWFEVTP
jgi:hypothetical protein